MIQVEHLSFSYNDHPVLEDITFSLSSGDSLAVIGPSGCGKTTLLYNLAGLRSPGTGRVIIGGVEVCGPREKTSVILQHYGLFPWKTVFENAALGLRIRGIPVAERTNRVSEILDELGILALRDRYPSQISGGQRQRVAIARALALDPDVLIMDEPLSSLDALTREAHQNLLLSLWREKSMTLIFVSHSITEAAFLGQKVAILSGGPAQVQEILDNSRVGEEDYRSQPDYQTTCNRLRDLLMGKG
jgi:NitT/TauT family transport system ATP-binding protein